jgi:hypothetical protein
VLVGSALVTAIAVRLADVYFVMAELTVMSILADAQRIPHP